MVRLVAFCVWLAGCLLAGAGARAEQPLFPEPPALRGSLPDAAMPAPAPMLFRLGRFAGGPGCGLACAELIYAVGEIRPDTVEALLILQSRLKRPLPVYLNSPGGNLEGGLALGRALRKAGMDAHVAALSALDCAADRRCAEADRRAGVAVFERAPRPASCNSACVYAFAGGLRRQVGEGSSLGVHRFFLARADDPLRRPLARLSRAEQSRLDRSSLAIAAYLADMGVDPELAALAAAVEPQHLRALGTGEMARLGLVTPAFGAPPAAAEGHESSWPVVTRNGRPALVASLTAETRRFGPVVSEIAIGCPAGGRYDLALSERLRGRALPSPSARIVAGDLPPDPGALSRDAALNADRSGLLVVEAVSESSAGYPARLEFSGHGLKAGIDRLDRACAE